VSLYAASKCQSPARQQQQQQQQQQHLIVPSSSSCQQRSCPSCPACPNTEGAQQLPPFKEAFRHLDWQRMKRERDEHGYYSGESLEDYLRILARYLAPKMPAPRVTERPQKLTVDCSKYPSVLTGKRREKPVRVFDMVAFGYELDVLEARFYELSEAVDIYVIMEGSRAHRGYRKPLFFAENMDRFKPFLNRTMYFVVDDSLAWKYRQEMHLPDSVSKNKNEVPQKWNIEVLQRDLLYKKFIEGFGDIGDDDLIIHGDMDEVPDGDVIFQMKHCEAKLPAGFCPQGYHNHMRFPANRRQSGTCFQPSVVTKQHINKNGGKVLYRYSPPHTVDAGVHATITGSLALQMYKYLSVAEGGIGPDKPFEFLQNPTGMPLDLAASGARVCCPNEPKRNAVHDDAELAKYWKPWFFEANKERFPDFLSHDLMLWKYEVGKRLQG
jgi:hypothetical protein